MGIWSSIRDFYRRWKPEIDLYGIGFLLFTSALITKKYTAAIIILFGVLIAHAVRRWGEPYLQAGKEEMERRKRVRKEYWDERFAELFSRFHKTPDDPPPATAETTRVIPQPKPQQRLDSDQDDLPESPGGIAIAEKPTSPAPPPVTHET